MKVLVIFLLVFVASWDLFWWWAGVRPISPRRLQKYLESPPDGPILVDVRTSQEYAWFHIEGAGSYPRLLIKPEELSPQAVESRPIVVVCLSGHRSPVVGYRLKKRGFQDVSYLAWGMIAWIISGGPTVKEGR